MSKQSTQRRLAQINGVAPQVISEAFTKQHYIAVAKILAKHNGDATAREIAEDLADLFAGDNAQFRRAQFLTACGIEA
jgi:hypothetical protein